jgi:hypothetical protein
VVTLMCSTPEAQAFHRALAAYVDAVEADPADTRTRGEKLVGCLMDLVLRPGEGEVPPVQALLTIVASVHTVLGGDQLGEVDGQAVPAEMARQLARAFAGLDPVADPAGADATAAQAAGTAASDDIAAADNAITQAAGIEWADADPSVAAASPAGDALEPVDVEGGPVERAALELSGADFDRWLDELVRAGFGDDPAPAPDHPDGLPGEPPDPAGWDAGPWHDPCEWLDDHGRDLADPDAEDPPPPHADTPAATPGAGWWATADRAVEDAGAAVHAARRALGAAGRMVRTAQRADAADEAAWQASTAGRVSAAEDALAALAAAADAQRAELAALLTATGGGLADRPRIAVTDATTGALLALTDLPGLRRTGTCGKPACRRRPQTCGHDLSGRPGLGRPGPTDGYTPGAELDRFVRARDRRCRFPGCRRRVPQNGELDHHRAYAEGGQTAAANLAGYCTGDHDPVGESVG